MLFHRLNIGVSTAVVAIFLATSFVCSSATFSGVASPSQITKAVLDDAVVDSSSTDSHEVSKATPIQASQTRLGVNPSVDILRQVEKAISCISGDFQSWKPVPSPFAQVTLSGYALGPGGEVPFMGFAGALNTSFSLVNLSVMDSSGHWAMDLPSGQDYYIIIITGSAVSVGGYYLHGYLPQARFVSLGNLDQTMDLVLQPAYTLVMETWDHKGNMIDYDNYTSQLFATAANDSTSCAVFTSTDKGSGTKAMSAVVPVGNERQLFVLHNVSGYGKVMLRADNGGIFWRFSGVDGAVLNMNYEFARTRYLQFEQEYSKMVSQGYQISPNVYLLKTQAKSALDTAGTKTKSEMAMWADTSLNRSMWGTEALALDRANGDILTNRMGSLTVNITDLSGNPVPLALATLNLTQETRDFDFGIFDNLAEVGNSTFKMLKDIGINYATEGFYWSASEPSSGGYDWNYLNSTVGIPYLDAMGYRLKAHALCYLHPLLTPGYVTSMNFSTLNQTVYEHVSMLVNTYKDYIDVFEASNEASGIGAMLNLTRDEMTQIIKTSTDAIRDSVPSAHITINNGFDWFGQSRSVNYMFGEEGRTQSIPEFLDWLDSHGVIFDGIEQQMYDGGHSDFGGLWSTDVPTWDYFELSGMADTLDSYGKPVRISEQSVSSEWDKGWKDAGYLHNPWNPKAQADFIKSFYTIMFSKKNFRGITWWDASDNNSFMNGGGLLDKNLKPKPSFYAIKGLIENWTTNVDATFNGSKPFSTPAFAGNYTVNLTWSLPGLAPQWQNITGFHISEGNDLIINLQTDTAIIPADLEVKTLGVSDPNPYINDTIDINSNVANNGPVPKYNISVEFLADGVVIKSNNINLTNGQEMLLTAPWKAYPKGDHNLTVRIDPGKLIEDNDRINNEKVYKITVNTYVPPAKYPDLVILAADIEIPSGDIYQGNNISFKARITNGGDIASISSNVSFYIGNPSSGGDLIGSKKSTGAIVQGGEVTITSDLWMPSSLGMQSVFVKVTDCIPNENDVSNNIAYKDFYVKTKPAQGADISIVKLTPSKTTPTEGDNVTYTAEVSNIGNIIAYNITIRFELDSTTTLAERVIPSIAPGKSTTVQVVWSAFTGTHIIKATADPQGKIMELSESNNALSSTITVANKPKPPVTGPEQFDMFNLAILLIVIFMVIAALVAMAKWRKRNDGT